MLHGDNAAAARDAVEPADLVTEPDDEPEQCQDARCPGPAEAHRHGTRCKEKRQPEGTDDRGPSKEGEIERERPRPAHRDISTRAPRSGPAIAAGSRRSVSGRASAPRDLTYAFNRSPAVP